VAEMNFCFELCFVFFLCVVRIYFVGKEKEQLVVLMM
jgi:hypothetical protein